MTAEEDLSKHTEVSISASDYESAEQSTDEMLKKNSLSLPELLERAQLEGSKTSLFCIMKAIRYYKAALAYPVLNEDIVAKICAGLQNALASAMYIASNKMLGTIGFDAHTRKTRFLNFTSTLKKALNDACEGTVIPASDILGNFSSLLLKSATFMREALMKRAEVSTEWMTVGTHYDDYKKSIDACIQIVEYAVKHEADTENKVRAYERLIGWLDGRLFLATNEPTINLASGETQYTWLETLFNPEIEQISEQRASYIQALELQKYIQALEILKAKSNPEKTNPA